MPDRNRLHEKSPLSKNNTVHGTSVAFAGRAVWLRGDTGSGKSDLAFRFLQTYGRGITSDFPLDKDAGVLVADDRLVLARSNGQVLVSSIEPLEGKLEIRGIGILEMPFVSPLPLGLIVDLVTSSEVVRLPDQPLAREDCEGIDIPLLALAPFEASAPDKLFLALTRLI